MKRVVPFFLAALLIPGAALAKGKPPTAVTHTNHGKARVMYVLNGTCLLYTSDAADE